MNKKICVLYGGMSAEREVSLRTGAAAADALKEKGYTDVTLLDVDFSVAEKLSVLKPDVCFNALHGTYGEDGRIQGLLEMMNIRYTGSGVEASVISFDKILTKMIFKKAGVPTADFIIVDASCGEAPYLPCVVKPPREGSSVGVSIVHSAEEFVPAVREAAKHDSTIMVERFIKGKELTVSVMDGTAFPIIWICPKKGVYDYESKYTAGMTEYLFETGLTEEETLKIQGFAKSAYDALGLKSAARVDFIWDGETAYALEANTVPGMTATSLLPKAARQAGISFPDLVGRMIESAVSG